MDFPNTNTFSSVGMVLALCSQVLLSGRRPGKLNTAMVALLCTQLATGAGTSPDWCQCPLCWSWLLCPFNLLSCFVQLGQRLGGNFPLITLAGTL